MADPNTKITITLVDLTKRGFKSITNSLGTLRGAINSTKTAVAGLAGAAGLGLLSKASIESAREVKNLAAAANASTTELQRLGFATESIGISTEKYADILKDSQDKIGDFIQNGGGPLADFFDNIGPKVGVTADQFRNLSGPQGLQAYFNALESANLAQSELIFFLEAIASDASQLIPLLRENGAAFEEQARRAEALGLILSDLDITALDELGKSLQRAAQVGQGFVDRFLVKFSPILIGVLNDFEQLVIEAGGFQTVIEKAFGFAIRAAGVFADGIRGVRIIFNLLQATASAVIGAISGGIGKLVGGIAELTGNEGLKGAADAMVNFQMKAFDTLDESTAKAKELSLAILPSEVINEKIKGYERFGNAVIKKNAEIAQSNIGATGTDVSETTRQEQERIRNKFALLQAETQGELALNRERLNQKLAQDVDFLQQQETVRLVGEERTNALIEQARADHALKMHQLEQKTIDDLISQQIDYGQRSETLAAQLAERQQTINELSARGRAELAAGAFREALSIAATGSKKLFEINKKLALSEAIINGFRAIQSGFATTPFFPVGLAMGALAAVKTAAQIRGIRSQQFGGGGSTPTASSGAAVPDVTSAESAPATQETAPIVQGPTEENRTASISISGGLNSRDQILEFAEGLVQLQNDGFNDLQILLGESA